MGLIDFESAKGKKRMNYIYSIGASVVIMGALFKILHIPYGDLIIGIGLATEAFIFFVSAFEPVYEDLKWERVYPELAKDADPSTFGKPRRTTSSSTSDVEVNFSEKLDKMFADARFDLSKIEKLGYGIERFSEATHGLVNVVDANKNAQSYSDQLAIAANHMSTLNTFYESHASQTAAQADISKAIVAAATSSSKYGEELTKAAEQVRHVNNLYQDQIAKMSQQVNMSGDMINSLAVSADDAKKMHDQVKNLTANLANLNSVYGGMLSAMNFNK